LGEEKKPATKTAERGKRHKFSKKDFQQRNAAMKGKTDGLTRGKGRDVPVGRKKRSLVKGTPLRQEEAKGGAQCLSKTTPLGGGRPFPERAKESAAFFEIGHGDLERERDYDTCSTEAF